MHFFFVPNSSSSSPSPANTSSFSLSFLTPQIPENLCKSPTKIHIGTHGISGQSFLSHPTFSSKNTYLYAVVDRSSSGVFSPQKESANGEGEESNTEEGVLVVRRPLLENSDKESSEEEGKKYPARIDAGLSNIAKKMPIFEPERSESSSSSSAAAAARAQERPLAVNLDLSLYKAKVLARNFRYKDAEKILEKVSNIAVFCCLVVIIQCMIMQF